MATIIRFLIFLICLLSLLLIGFVHLIYVFFNVKRFWAVARGIDQTLNAVLAGHEDEMISTKIYRKAREGKIWAIILEYGLNLLDPNHTYESFKTDNK